MGKKQNAVYAEMMALLKKMQNPEENKAQNFLTTEALAGADWLKKGDFSQLPKGMFFDFQMPAEQMRQYEKASNVGRTGTFALGDHGGMGAAVKTQSQFLGDKFARDAAQNYQNNVRGVGDKVQNSLIQASGAKSQNDSAVITALQNLYGSPALNKPGVGGALIGAIGGIGGGLMNSMKPWSF